MKPLHIHMVNKWAVEFKRGRESLEDDPRSGKAVTVTTDDMIDKIHDKIQDNHARSKETLTFHCY